MYEVVMISTGFVLFTGTQPQCTATVSHMCRNAVLLRPEHFDVRPLSATPNRAANCDRIAQRA